LLILVRLFLLFVYATDRPITSALIHFENFVLSLSDSVLADAVDGEPMLAVDYGRLQWSTSNIGPPSTTFDSVSENATLVITLAYTVASTVHLLTDSTASIHPVTC